MRRKGFIDRGFLKLVTDSSAPCLQKDPELFYPASEAHFEEQAQEAKAVCKRCPITATCLEWALEANDQHAVLGGMTPKERHALRRSSYRRAA